jgi:hypothetical protein
MYFRGKLSLEIVAQIFLNKLASLDYTTITVSACSDTENIQFIKSSKLTEGRREGRDVTSLSFRATLVNPLGLSF